MVAQNQLGLPAKLNGTTMTNGTITAAREPRHGLPANCPSCGQTLGLGIQFLHSVGPGRAARRIASVAVLLGLGTFAYAVLVGNDSFGGYGAASSVLAGLLVWAVGNQIAARLPRARRLRCRACSWQREVPAG